MALETKVINEIKKNTKTIVFSPVVEYMMRIGYGARGLIYGIIGLLALLVAFSVSGSLSDQQGAIADIGKQPIGQVLLIIVLIGLVGYVLWGLVRALFDPLHKGKSMKGIIERIGFFISAVAYAILIIPTYNFILGNSNAAQNGAQGVQLRNIIGTIFLFPLGIYIVGIIGVIFLLVGLYQAYLGLKKNFDKRFNPYILTSKQVKYVKIMGRFGYVGRAVVFFFLGIFLIFAAYYSNSSKAKGIDGVLLFILQQPYGHYLLGIVALGLIAFGAYSILSGFWFKLKKP